MNEQLEFDPDLVVDQLNQHRGAVKDAGDDYYDLSDDDSENGCSYDYTSDGVSFLDNQIENKQANLLG